MYYILLGTLIGFIFTTIIFNVIKEETNKSVSREALNVVPRIPLGGTGRLEKKELTLRELSEDAKAFGWVVYSEREYSWFSLLTLAYSDSFKIWLQINNFETEMICDEHGRRMIVSRGTNERQRQYY